MSEINMERLVADHLRADEAVSEIVGRRVVVTSPDQRDTPWIRLTQLSALDDEDSGAEFFLNYLLQVDCYAGKDNGQPEVTELGIATRAALKRMRETDFNEAVVSEVKVVGSSRTPDTDGFEPARQRRMLTVRIWAHEVAGVPS